MSQNPYANPYPQPHSQGYPPGYASGVPARTSAMAVLSLVCSLVCCIPGLSILGVLFGGMSLLAIGMSGGKVKGVGLAISGLIIGIVLTVVWILVVIGVMQMAGMFNSMVDPALKAIDQRDGDAARAMFVSSAHPTIDDARIEEFGSIMDREYGTYERMADGLGELVSEFGNIMSNSQVGPATQAAQAKYGQSGVFPMPARFDSGWHAIMIYMDSTGNSGTGAGGMPLLRDIGIVMPDGSTEWLVGGNSGGTTGTPRLPRPTPAGDNGPNNAPGADSGDDEGSDETAPAAPAPAPAAPAPSGRRPKP